MDKIMDKREIIGHYHMGDGSMVPMYKPEKGSLCTQAFIFCCACHGVIATSGRGIPSNAVCLKCYPVPM